VKHYFNHPCFDEVHIRVPAQYGKLSKYEKPVKWLGRIALDDLDIDVDDQPRFHQSEWHQRNRVRCYYRVGTRLLYRDTWQDLENKHWSRTAWLYSYEYLPKHIREIVEKNPKVKTYTIKDTIKND
jgi:hypothetical protein